MNQADLRFFGAIKEANLSEESISALGIEDPASLETMEEQIVPPVEQESPAQKKKPVEIEVPATFLKRDNVHPLRILVFLKSKYNDEWVRWLPETLWATLRQDVGSVGEVSQNKIQALAVALSTDAPWQDWTTFENCGRAFNNTIPVFGQIQPLSPAETAFTVHILKRLHPFKFSEEVVGYMAAVCLHNGMVFTPKEWFDSAQKTVDNIGSSIAVRDEVKEAWKQVKKSDLTDVEFNDSKHVDVHIAKLWAIREYLADKKAQMKET